MDSYLEYRECYVRHVIDCYCRTPGTLGRARQSDWRLAAQLHDLGVPLFKIEDALVLATARRTFRAGDAPPLPVIRSLHYFLPIIYELLESPIDRDYLQDLQDRLDNFYNQELSR